MSTYSRLSIDADPSDPYTEARWEEADRQRREWLDAVCKREVEATRAARDALKLQAAKGGRTNRKVTRTHTVHPCRPTLTYCGRRLGDRPKVGHVEPHNLSDKPSCVTCALRLARSRASE